MKDHPSVKDERSRKIIILSHCCLNQNAKVRGLAQYPGAVRPLVELLLSKGVGIYQMPCPEMTYLGNMRWGQVKDQYNTPMFRRHCRKLAETVLDEVENYRQCGYHIVGFVMVDGSPVCGLNWTPQPTDKDMLWGGMAWYIPESEHINDKGNFSEILQEEIAQRGNMDDIPFIAFPELEELGSMQDTLKKIEALLA